MDSTNHLLLEPFTYRFREVRIKESIRNKTWNYSNHHSTMNNSCRTCLRVLKSWLSTYVRIVNFYVNECFFDPSGHNCWTATTRWWNIFTMSTKATNQQQEIISTPLKHLSDEKHILANDLGSSVFFNCGSCWNAQPCMHPTMQISLPPRTKLDIDRN